MAVTGKGSKIFVDKSDFSAEGRSIDISIDQDTVDTTTFSGDAKGTMGGIVQAKIDYKGVWNKTDSSGLGAFLTSNLGVVGKGITVIPGVPVEGGTAYHGEILATSKPISIPIGDLITLGANFTINGPLGRGTILQYKDAATKLSTADARDMGLAASGYSCLAGQYWMTTIHCWEYNGATSSVSTLTIQECDVTDDLSAWATVVTLQMSGEAGAYYGLTAGPRKQYARSRFYSAISGFDSTIKMVGIVSVVSK